MFEKSYIKKSRQTWKLWVFIGSALGALLAFAPVLTGWVSDELLGTILLFSGLLIGVAGFVWFFASVRCKQCRTRIAWKAVREQSAQMWLHQLFAYDSCPACGHVGAATKADQP